MELLHFNREGHRFLWFGASWSSMASWSLGSPLTPFVSQMPRRDFIFGLDHAMKKSLEKWSEKYVNSESKMEAKWVHKFEIIWIMPSMHGEHYRSRQHVSKNNEKSWSADPEKLDFDVPSRAKTQLPLFHIYWKCHQLGTQMGFRLVCIDALRRES